jgi:SAM-dependent methyltransferase
MSGALLTPTHAHAASAASPWLQRWAHLLPPGARVLDVACGGGRHLAYLSERGCVVTGVDRDGTALALAAERAPSASLTQADIEHGPWPWPGRQFDAVVITNYLWRPLIPTLRASVALGGVLIWETFAHGNETVGKPSRPDFLLAPGELLRVAEGWRVIAYEDGFVPEPARFVQRIVAVNQAAEPSAPPRYPLT